MSAVQQKPKSKPKTIEDVLEGIEAIRPVLAENVAKTEADRQIADANMQALQETGALSIMTPKRYGGLELTPADVLKVTASIAESCGSTSWVVTVMLACNWTAALLPVQAQDDIWGDNPDARVVGVLNPSPDVKKVDGGYELSGKWPFASGSGHADWAFAGMLVPDENGQIVDHGLAFLPMSDVTIEDTWHVAGMRGTGSNTIIADKVFVPDHRWYSVPAAIENQYATENKDEELYRTSFIPFVGLTLAGPQLGLGRAALKYVLEKAPKRAIAYTVFEKQTDSVAFQLEVSKAAMLIDTAELHVKRATEDLARAAKAGEPIDLLGRARIKADASLAVTSVREAIDKLMTAHGASAFADVSPMQQIWRDSNTSGRHAGINPLVGDEAYGKLLLGVEEQVTPVL